jgi:flagellar biosynthetic protein FliQ
MTVEIVLELSLKALLTILYVVGPPLAAAMAVGLIISVLQAATQIQETSLTFVPKIAAMGVTLLLSGRWGIGHLTVFLREVMDRMATMGQ